MSHVAMKCHMDTFTKLLLWMVLVLLVTFYGVETEVASSVSAMTSLISQEEKLIEHLGKVLDLARVKNENTTWIGRIQRYLDCIGAKHRLIAARMPGDLAHPVIGFRLVRRLAKDWNDVTTLLGESMSRQDNANALHDNLRGMHDVISRWTRWPKPQDVRDAAMALIRIGSTYDLYPTVSHLGQGQRFPLGERPSVGTSEDLLTTSSQISHRRQSRLENDITDDNNSNTMINGMDSLENLIRRHSPCKYRNCNNNDSNCENEFLVESCTKHDDVVENYIEESIAVDDYSNDNSNKTSNTNYKMSSINNATSKTTSNSNEPVTSSIKNTRKVSNKRLSSCEDYNYTSLECHDFVYLINIAIHQKLKVEASNWYRVLELGILDGERSDHGGTLRNKMDKLQRKISKMKTRDPETDDIMKKYVQLCHQASKVDFTTPLPPSTRLYCSWRHSHPYLRYNVELLHVSPDIYQFYDVIASGEMRHIKDMAKEKLVPSALDIEANTRENARYWRVSQTAWLQDETDVLQRLSKRVGQLMGLDTGIVTDNRGQFQNVYAEPLQVVNYGLGGLYGPHLDTLHPSTSSQHEREQTKHTGDRLATWMFYLGDVRIGGATVFPRINVSVRPIKGSAILWYNLLRNGQVDKRTVHAGCPVVMGDKWVANKWVRDTAQWKTRPCLLDPSL